MQDAETMSSSRRRLGAGSWSGTGAASAVITARSSWTAAALATAAGMFTALFVIGRCSYTLFKG